MIKTLLIIKNLNDYIYKTIKSKYKNTKNAFF